MGGGRWQVGGGRWEEKGGRWEKGGGRWEVGGGRWEGERDGGWGRVVTSYLLQVLELASKFISEIGNKNVPDTALYIHSIIVERPVTSW